MLNPVKQLISDLTKAGLFSERPIDDCVLCSHLKFLNDDLICDDCSNAIDGIEMTVRGGL